ncbi:MAG: FAD-dependent oxidoreductase, partial [Hyphomicrobiaceae bacterium]|nr:FAD-dependent oxidoreductase [Hyphomicrobiaceae bacterium]
LPVRHPYIAMMPQWDFLDFVAEQGRRYPGFTLIMQAVAGDLIRSGERVTGLRASTPDGPLEIEADLVVAADGRHSNLRAQAGLELEVLGAPMDVLWFRLSRAPGDPGETFGRFAPGGLMVHINRGNYWQCALVIPKGAADRVRQRGLDAFRQQVGDLAPWAVARLADDLRTWEDVRLLSVRVDRLKTWYRPGLLAIGDAAHAMSPVGGVGINLAIQDAVAAANILWEPLRDKQLDIRHLAAVQRRREWPTRATQRLQVLVQNRVIGPALASDRPLRPPLLLRLAARLPFVRRLAGRIIGLGLRPEHVRSPELPPVE